MPQISQTAGRAYPRTPLWRVGPISGRASAHRQVRRSGFEWEACSAAPSGPVLVGAGLALRGELSIQPLKHGVGTVIGAQPQDPAPRMFDHAPSLEHDLLHHRLHASALGRMAAWRNGASLPMSAF